MRKLLSGIVLSTGVAFLSYEVALSIQQSDFVGMAIGIGLIFYILLGGVDIASDSD